MSFGGFDPAAIARLAELPSWDGERYAQEKAALRTGLVEPGMALIGDVAGALGRRLTVKPRSSASPLNQDLRFAPEGAARYKDHLIPAFVRFCATRLHRVLSVHQGLVEELGS